MRREHNAALIQGGVSIIGSRKPSPCLHPPQCRRWSFSGPAASVKVPPRSLFPGGKPTRMRTIILLTISNIFMTFAWYGHLKYRESPLWKAIVVSWMIAFVEYCFQVPANRIGSYRFSTAQLKTIQEVITLLVFSVFSVLYLREQFRWNYVVAFMFLVGAVFFMFYE
jgi:uncharacterized protein (DUF486 family)